jgi:antitoxin HicB
MNFAWRIEVTPDGDGLLVTSPAFPELTTFGADEADARVHARDALEEAIAARIAQGRDLPLPDAGEGGVAIPLLSGLKAMLYARLRAEGITRAELQRRLEWPSRESVDRLFRLDHQSRLDQIEAAFQALGQRVDVALIAA